MFDFVTTNNPIGTEYQCGWCGVRADCELYFCERPDPIDGKSRKYKYYLCKPCAKKAGA